MTDRSVQLLLRRSERRVKLSCDLRDNMTRCLEESLEAIAQSRRLLANSEPLVGRSEESGCGCSAPAPDRTEPSESGPLPVVFTREFDGEAVPVDGKHFCDCTFANCTLLYRGTEVTFESCQFHNCKFEFSGEAGRTVQFLDCFGLLTERNADRTSCKPDSALVLVN